jgi:hypothetical protein
VRVLLDAGSVEIELFKFCDYVDHVLILGVLRREGAGRKEYLGI